MVDCWAAIAVGRRFFASWRRWCASVAQACADLAKQLDKVNAELADAKKAKKATAESLAAMTKVDVARALIRDTTNTLENQGAQRGAGTDSRRCGLGRSLDSDDSHSCIRICEKFCSGIGVSCVPSSKLQSQYEPV